MSVFIIFAIDFAIPVVKADAAAQCMVDERCDFQHSCCK